MNMAIRFILILMCIFLDEIMAYAEIYIYVDERGVTHLTNIPPQREDVKVIPERQSNNKYAYYQQIINDLSRKYDIDPSLVMAVIEVESNWDTMAVSRRGAMGLMQLMPSTISALDIKDPFNPEENIEGGIRYLRYLLDKFDGDLRLSLAAYNAGPKTIENHKDVPPIPETEQFVEQVLTLYNNRTNNSTKIYKIIRNDGTILYTNTPFFYQRYIPSKF